MEITENKSQRCGWAQSFNLTCVNPECDASQVQFELSTSHVHIQFGIHDKCVLGFRSIWKGHTHAEKFSAVMDLPPPLTHKSFANITHKIENVSEEVVQVKLKRAAAITKEIVSNTDGYSDSINENRNKTECGVTIDGSWLQRGRSSKQGITPATNILDKHYLCSSCPECTKWANKPHATSDKLEWFVKHEEVCLINHDGSSYILPIYSRVQIESFSHSCHIYFY